jgi:dTDP-L-rhamnose 4-epimerase
MSHRHVLITGGAGFIGSHLADELLAAGDHVRALDVLDPQVHGEARARPAYLSADVELVVGDVRDRAAVERALADVDAVFHFAAAVGVGQSMYDVARYIAVNDVGTAVLLEALISHRVQRLVLASSMSLYGEGLQRDARGATFEPSSRPLEQLARRQWELLDARGERGLPIPTPETKAASLESIYALSKFDQEKMSMMMGRAYGIPTVALRFFNVYGARQALSNPYTGVLAIFASRLLNGHRPMVFEDGQQRRDFVSVHDVVRACVAALESDAAPGRVLNVGSGKARSVDEVARVMAAALGRPELEPELTGTYRMGDVRHCFADITAAREVLGYAPRVAFEDGVAELAQWLKRQVAEDRAPRAKAELEARGLTV